MQSFSPEFDNQLRREIMDLFDMIDKDRSGDLSTEEIIKFLQPSQ